MNLFDFDEGSIFNQAVVRGMDGSTAEAVYNRLVDELDVPGFIARQVALGEISIPEERLVKIGHLFGRKYNHIKGGLCK